MCKLVNPKPNEQKSSFYHLVILGLIYKRKEYKSLFGILFCPFTLITIPPPAPPTLLMLLAKSRCEILWASQWVQKPLKLHVFSYDILLTHHKVVKGRTTEYRKNCRTRITHSNRKKC